MFKQLGNLTALLQQAQSMSAHMKGVQERLAGRRCTGRAPGGQVEIEVNGQNEVLNCRIDPALLAAGNSRTVEQLVVAAANDAIGQARAAAAEEMQQATGGLKLPGISEMLAGLGLGGAPR